MHTQRTLAVCTLLEHNAQAAHTAPCRRPSLDRIMAFLLVVLQACLAVSPRARARWCVVLQPPCLRPRSRYKIVSRHKSLLGAATHDASSLRRVAGRWASYRSPWHAASRRQACSSYHDTIICIVTHLPAHTVL